MREMQKNKQLAIDNWQKDPKLKRCCCCLLPREPLQIAYCKLSISFNGSAVIKNECYEIKTYCAVYSNDPTNRYFL
jgi:hypothetical protein